MINTILLAFSFLVGIYNYFNHARLKRRIDTLEIVLAKKNLLTWDDPAWKLNDADKELLKELNK